MSVSAITVNTTATVLKTENFARVGIIIDNQSAVDVFMGDGSDVTTANGITLAAGEKYISTPPGDQGSFYYKGDYYGIVASSTADVRVLELVTSR